VCIYKYSHICACCQYACRDMIIFSNVGIVAILASTRACTLQYVCLYARMCLFKSVCVFSSLYACIQVCMHACMHACIHVCACVYACGSHISASLPFMRTRERATCSASSKSSNCAPVICRENQIFSLSLLSLIKKTATQ